MKNFDEFTVLLKNLPIIIFRTEFFLRDMQIEYKKISILNPDYFCEHYGYSIDELDSIDFWPSRIHPDDKRKIFEKLLDLQMDNVASYDCRFLNKDGSYIWVKVTDNIINRDGLFFESVGFVQDITKEKVMLDKIEESSDLFSIISEQFSLGICVFNKDKILYVNKFLKDTLGLVEKEFLESDISKLHKNLSNFEEVELIFQEIFSRNDIIKCVNDVRIRRNDAKTRFFNILVNPFRYKGEDSFLSIFFDITKQKNFEMLYSALKDINQILVRSIQEDEALKNITDLLVRKIGFKNAIFGDVDEQKNFRLLHSTGGRDSFIEDYESLNISVGSEVKENYCTIQAAYFSGKISLISDILKTQMPDALKNLFIKFSIRSVCSIPIKIYNKIKYILVIFSDTPDMFSNEYMNILEEVEEDISFAMEKIDKERNIKLQQEKIVELTKLYKTISEINSFVVKVKSYTEIFENAPKILVENAGFDFVFFATINKDHLEMKSFYATNDRFVDFKDYIVDVYKEKDIRNLSDFFITAQSFLTGEIVVDNNILDAKRYAPVKEKFKDFASLSAAAIPIYNNENKVGVVYYCATNKKGYFNESILNLLGEIASDISFALNKVEMERFSSLTMLALNSGNDFVIVTDKNFNIIYVSDNTERIFGFSKKELIGKHHSIFSSKSQSLSFSRRFYRTIRGGQKFADVFIYKKKSGEKFYCYTTVSPFVIDNDIKYFVAVGKDITQEKALSESVERLVDFDSLTNLPNRKKFLEEVDSYLKIAKYSKKIFAVIIVNPISFSDVNHAYGFYKGDMVLKEIAKRLKDLLFDFDIIARLESEKFAILVKELSSLNDVVGVVDKVFLELNKLYNIADNNIKLFFNVGISFYPVDSNNAEKLLEKANIAVKEAKEKGENSIGFYKKELESFAVKSLKLKDDLSQAVKNNEFVLYYQPYFSTYNNSMIGAEVLLRWKRNDNIILPSEFIAFLEKSDLIVEVERGIIDHLVEKFNEWQINKYSIVPISVNLSTKSFESTDFKEHLFDLLKNNKLPQNYINIEIIERLFINDFSSVRIELEDIKRRGINISLDDFGTGFSSFNYLYQLPLDILKIDMSFIRNMLIDDKAMAIVESILKLAKRLKINSLAEGVENIEQLKILEELGCDYIQGYLLARPMAEEDFEELIKTQ
ncbi:EAL domain-containing protein [Thermodesulfobium sp. 4217-1]|uniref:EAL domain-containing protein n=1 Tax=Thermodesulfobium sp. 4217-1 TaxID=3120013 RepID=UPI0032221336